MSLLLFLLRAGFVAVWMTLGLSMVVLAFPLLAQRVSSAISRHWSRILMRLCGVGIRMQGEPRLAGPVLWVANHVSWVDVFVLNSVRTTSFIAKSEIRHWPLIGRMVAGSDTIFIERGQRYAVRKVGRQMKAHFERGGVIGLFPEGTTSPGFNVAPFHSSLFDVAIRAHVDIQPVALRFFVRGQRSDYVAFVGEQNLLQNLWRLLGATGVLVELEFLPVMTHDYCQQHGRGKAAAHAHKVILDAVMRRHTPGAGGI